MADIQKVLASVPRWLSDLMSTDPGHIAAAATDFGRIVRHRPAAVFRPRTHRDVAEIVQVARDQAVSVAARGQGNSGFGQAQARGGFVIEMSGLAEIGVVQNDAVWVDAGVKWATLLDRTMASRQAPPAVTDYLHLSVGGTLSVGGISGTSFRYGAQVDNVLALKVVTGDGDLVECSPHDNPDLFDACRAGLGQVGIVVAARARLTHVPSHVRVYNLQYDDLGEFLDDQTRLADDGRFDYLHGTVVAVEPGRHMMMLEAAVRFPWGAPPDDRRLLDGLCHMRDRTTIADHAYITFARRVDLYVLGLRALGVWDVPHPWINLFVPASEAKAIYARQMKALAGPRDGMILSFPLRRSRCRAPLLMMPDDERLFLCDLLRNVVPGSKEPVDSLLLANRRTWLDATKVGARMYPIGSVPFEAGDWEGHFGSEWHRLCSAKARFDPARILGIGRGIFPPP